MGLRIGVDIGGSFTDFAVLDEEKRSVRTLKVLSRPDSPGSEVIAGMEGLKDLYDIDPHEVIYFTHGTTVGVNAVVQRKGLRLGLITTLNFEDVLDVARLKIPDMYHLMSCRPPPLIPRDRVFGVAERLAADGSEETCVDEPSVLDAIRALRAARCEGVVISLLHSYRNPAHEQEVKSIIQRVVPDLFVCCSSEVWPIIREYERTVTATIGAYVQPHVSQYLSNLQSALRDSGISTDLKVTKSNGGVMSAENGKSNCVQMILSGTASGVIGAAYIAQTCNLRNCMSLDIGGTTADVALIIDGKPQYATGEYIGDFQIHIPSVSVSSIGDGGGSIAWVDSFGVLKIGPESAGSNPGPVCYGRGGTSPTITDAFAVIGVLGLAALGYNAVKLDVAAARRAFEPLAKQLGLDVYRTAAAVIDVSISGMYVGISRLSSRFGIDPRAFSLMPFGGAGPMLGCFLARALNVRKLLVPTAPGVLSALGGLIADTKNDFVRTTYYPLDNVSVERLAKDLSALEAEARAWIIKEISSAAAAELIVSADMRYRGQSFEIDTPLSAKAVATGDTEAISDAFHLEHQRLFGHCDRTSPIQVVALRLVITSPTPKPELPQIAVGEGVLQAESVVPAFFDGEWRDASLYRRSALLSGHRFIGPAIVTQDDTTTCVLPGFEGGVDAYGNLILEAV